MLLNFRVNTLPSQLGKHEALSFILLHRSKNLTDCSYLCFDSPTESSLKICSFHSCRVLAQFAFNLSIDWEIRGKDDVSMNISLDII